MAIELNRDYKGSGAGQQWTHWTANQTLGPSIKPWARHSAPTVRENRRVTEPIDQNWSRAEPIDRGGEGGSASPWSGCHHSEHPVL